MRKFYKVLICLVAVLMIVPMVVSCASLGKNKDTDTDPVQSTDVTETQTEVETDEHGQVVIDNTELRDLDFNGKTIYFAVRENQYKREWFAEEPKTDLENKVYYRNIAVQEEINVNINYNSVKSADADKCKNLNALIRNVGESGMGGLDVVSHYAAFASNAALIPYYKNWYNSQLTYLNLENPYWNQSFISSAEAFGRLFLCVGDVNLSVYDRCHVVYFNKALAEVHSDTVGDLYQTAIDGNWTADVMLQMVKNVGTYTNSTSGDQIYALASIKGSEASDGFLYAWDAWLTQEDNNGMHTVVTDADYTKLSNAFDLMCDFWYESGGAHLLAKSQENYDFFTQGYALFDIDVLYHYDSGWKHLNEITDGFGILPLPKYDDTQLEYYTGVQDAHNVLSIMENGMKSDFDMVSAVLELMCAENYSTVRPEYIKTTVKGQFLDAKSGECFDLVLNGARWDFADIYAAAVGGVRNKLWRTPFQKSETASQFSSSYGENAGSLNTNFSEFDTWLATQY
ncbi:MAG: hypothetical protein IJ011_03685 [Clostridia bacterium]|nr:hypothetical protein [Clostridia bacterium]